MRKAYLPLYSLLRSQEVYRQAAVHEVEASRVIQPGDTLFQICMDRYGSSEEIREICELNDITVDEIIYPGQVIVLP